MSNYFHVFIFYLTVNIHRDYVTVILNVLATLYNLANMAQENLQTAGPKTSRNARFCPHPSGGGSSRSGAGQLSPAPRPTSLVTTNSSTTTFYLIDVISNSGPNKVALYFLS